ncbi:hypothetical protein [Streptomyces sp. SID13726]|uniref:hypothetical protein n=1 Tax=Streptomyces sp. SID13726 TaxID=2706058 RepID=UPI0013BA7B3F|nr:hypothetical protein [Streptomyces sp. SID13726]NEB01412.1 hypothetical protein [Streptomyces sp. SID13726]
MGPNGTVDNHGPSAEQLRLLLQAVLAELPRSDTAEEEGAAGAARSEAAAELDQELTSPTMRPRRALDLLDRITASVGGAAAAGAAAAQLAATLQAM